MKRVLAANIPPSPKCKSVWKLHAILQNTFLYLTSASKYYQMLLGPSGAKQSAPRFCKSILRCSSSTWSFGGAFRMLKYLTYRMIKFWSSWDLCAGLRETSRAAETLDIWSIRPQTILEHNPRRTCRCPLGKPSNALAGGCGGIICFWPPPPLSLPGGSWQGLYVDTGVTEMVWGTWGGCTEIQG